MNRISASASSTKVLWTTANNVSPFVLGLSVMLRHAQRAASSLTAAIDTGIWNGGSVRIAASGPNPGLRPLWHFLYPALYIR
ncbi:hypothetical protein ACN2XU_23980, partial [Primorskyibacter sp. 2E107]|uniref:hypothetical protein n=1 Tax=Primorskyibacter sp. 2E107 TaxID=3403458 RepID=UPI003AF56ADE